ncbi:MAG: HAMP domain-containing histidine kinase [Acidobacteria bacterium]|nr:HAMP domain-containing histidine kinase [Acidobacteriota bacterium]
MFSAIQRRLRLSSVRARLTFWYLLTLGTTLVLFGSFVLLIRARTLYRELDADLEVRAHQLAGDLRTSLLALDVGERLAAEPRAVEAPLTVWESPDTLLFRSPAFPTLDWAGERTLTTAIRDHRSIVGVVGRGGVPLRMASVAIGRPGTEGIVLQVAASTLPARQTLWQLALAMLASISIVLIMASYGSGVTARRALAPVDAIVDRVRRIQASRLGDRLDIQAGSDELDRLVSMLNQMLDRIEVSMRSARRFAADASHELQTPIAAMRGVIEAGLRNGGRGADYPRVAADLLIEIERLSDLVRDLRLLALAEAGHLLEPPVPIDLAALAGECCEIAQAIAEEKQVAVTVDVRDRPVVSGSALHLRRLVLNLAQNAIRYSRPDSSVCVSIRTLDGRAVLGIQDHGCGIGADDLPHIFEPFYRADPARARDTGGTGLGLTIADQIARVHGGSITVTSALDQGSTFTLSLPLVSKSGNTPGNA